MHAIRFRTPRQLFTGLCAKVRHAEPRRHAKKKAERIEASNRVAECERELHDCLWGHDPHYGVSL